MTEPAPEGADMEGSRASERRADQLGVPTQGALKATFAVPRFHRERSTVVNHITPAARADRLVLDILALPPAAVCV